MINPITKIEEIEYCQGCYIRKATYTCYECQIDEQECFFCNDCKLYHKATNNGIGESGI